MNLDGKVAVVTGGATGNGRGIAEVFLKNRMKVAIFDYANELDDTVKALQEKYIFEDVFGYLVDIRDSASIKVAVEDVVKRFGHIDVLVNNAGVCRLASFKDTTDELRDFHFDINIKGTWNVTKEVLPYLTCPGGSIINLSSVTGVRVADPGEVAYATTKAAIAGFTKGLAADLASQNIRVNAILPGYIRTPMVEGMAKESNPEDPESVIEGIAASIPLKRMGSVFELGELAAFLSSDVSRYITAETIVFDGGSTLPETNSMGV